MKVTYGQYHGNDLEDKFIVENFDLKDKGVFVDIGAGPNGVQGNNTYFFEKNGWDGLVIDGDPRVYSEMLKTRTRPIEAVISNDETVRSYFMNEKTPDLSGLVNYPDNSSRSIKVIPIKLEKILEQNNIDKIDLLSVDTEGTETDVLDSMDFDKHRPEIIIAEFLTQGNVHTEIQPYLKEKGYRYVARVGPNLIFDNDINNV